MDKADVAEVIRHLVDEERLASSMGARVIQIAPDAYTGNTKTKHLQPGHELENEVELEEFGGWYDLIVTLAGDSTFSYRLAGHVETGEDSISDPAMGGLVTLKG